jgi:transcriptional regulator with XRE-family HTH domain
MVPEVSCSSGRAGFRSMTAGRSRVCPGSLTSLDDPTAMAPIPRVAQRLKQLRRARGWTQQTLATKAQISRGYLLRLEAAQQDPTLGVLTRLAHALRVPIATITASPPIRRPTVMAEICAELAADLRLHYQTTGCRPARPTWTAMSTGAYPSQRVVSSHVIARRARGWLKTLPRSTTLVGAMTMRLARGVADAGTWESRCPD